MPHPRQRRTPASLLRGLAFLLLALVWFLPHTAYEVCTMECCGEAGAEACCCCGCCDEAPADLMAAGGNNALPDGDQSTLQAASCSSCAVDVALPFEPAPLPKPCLVPPLAMLGEVAQPPGHNDDGSASRTERPFPTGPPPSVASLRDLRTTQLRI